MSPRSRHNMVTRDPQYSCEPGYYIPRNRTSPRPSLSAFSSASKDVMMNDSNFSLSSAASGPQRYAECHSWDTLPGQNAEPPDSFVSMGFNVLNDVDPYEQLPMMMPTTAPYSYTSDNVLPRVSCDMDQAAQVVTQDFVLPDYLEYAACTSSTDLNSATAACIPLIFQGPPSPPDEHEVEQELAISKHSPSQDNSPSCEQPLGVPKLPQLYRGTSRAPPYHRLIRPHSDRTNAQEVSQHVPSPMSPVDDSHDKAKARKDPRYSAPPDEDGFFRCPLVETSGCTHKPTKQRCIYAKYLDSHLRPYKCKNPACITEGDDARFSSNACLFRHEREAHGMHCHGMNPYLCKFPNCPRSRPDNGFPRSWNQRDHMKRVHQWSPQKGEDEVPSRRPAPESRRRKGTSLPGSVPMERSNSSHYMQAGYSRDSRYSVPGRDQVDTYRQGTADSVIPYDVPNLSFSEYQTPGFF